MEIRAVDLPWPKYQWQMKKVLWHWMLVVSLRQNLPRAAIHWACLCPSAARIWGRSRGEFFNKHLQSLTSKQGDQIGRIFNIWLLFTRVFLKFYPSKQFQNTVCCTNFNIQKQFDATIFDFQFGAFVIWLQFWLHFWRLGDLFKLLVTLHLR